MYNNGKEKGEKFEVRNSLSSKEVNEQTGIGGVTCNNLAVLPAWS